MAAVSPAHYIAHLPHSHDDFCRALAPLTLLELDRPDANGDTLLHQVAKLDGLVGPALFALTYAGASMLQPNKEGLTALDLAKRRDIPNGTYDPVRDTCREGGRVWHLVNGHSKREQRLRQLSRLPQGENRLLDCPLYQGKLDGAARRALLQNAPAGSYCFCREGAVIGSIGKKGKLLLVYKDSNGALQERCFKVVSSGGATVLRDRQHAYTSLLQAAASVADCRQPLPYTCNGLPVRPQALF